jgi:hypothetical protein
VPKVEIKHCDLDWRKIWSRLAPTGLLPLAVNTSFSMLHYILPLQVCCHRLQLANLPACRHCDAPVEDVCHFFTACPRVLDTWGRLAAGAGRALGAPFQTNTSFIFTFPSTRKSCRWSWPLWSLFTWPGPPEMTRSRFQWRHTSHCEGGCPAPPAQHLCVDTIQDQYKDT